MSETEKSKPKGSSSTSTIYSSSAYGSSRKGSSKSNSRSGSGSRGSSKNSSSSSSFGASYSRSSISVNAINSVGSSSSSTAKYSSKSLPLMPPLPPLGFKHTSVDPRLPPTPPPPPARPPPTQPPPPPPASAPAPSPVPAPASASRSRPQYQSTSGIRKAFLNYMKDPVCLELAAEYLYESLLEDAVMGIYLEVHYLFKSGAMQAIEGDPEDESAFKIVEAPNYDVFGVSKNRKPMDFNCPNCERLVAAIRFAPHLEKCMGMGRKTSRTASRRLATKETTTSYFASLVSDDDDDADWSTEKRRKKIQSRSNGSRRNGKSS